MLRRLAQEARSQSHLVAVHGLCEGYTHVSKTLVSFQFRCGVTWCQPVASALQGCMSREHVLSGLILDARADGLG